MAGTVRDLAVKITADTTELQKSTKAAITTVKQLATQLKNIFKGVDKEVTKAANAVNKGIDKAMDNVNKRAQEAGKAVEKTTQQRLKTVQSGSKKEQKIHSDSQKAILRQRQNALKEATRLERQRSTQSQKAMKDNLKALERTAGQFKLDIVQIETEEPIKNLQDLGRALQNTNRNTQEQIRRELKGLDSQKEADINKAQANLKAITKRANEEQRKAIVRASAQRIRLAGNNAAERVRIEKEMLKELAQARKEGNARLAAIDRTADTRREEAPNEERTGRIGRGGSIISEIGSSAQGAAGALGPLGGALGKLGPVGLAVGAGLGVAVAAFKAVSEAAGKFNDGLAKIKTTINDSQLPKLNQEMSRLRDFSAQTGVPIEQLSEGVFNAASAVSAFKDDVGAAVDAVQIASTAAVGLGADSGELVSVMGDLANSFGVNAADSENLQFIMDNMSTTFRDGKISGSDLSQTIVNGAKSMSLLSADAKTGISTLSAFTASMTASGINANKTSTAIDAFQNELLDMDKATELAEAGLDGISTAGGKVQVDFEKLFKSAGTDFEKFAQKLGSKQAKLAFRTLAGDGESAFLSVNKGFKDVAGSSQKAFEIMQDTGKAASERVSASMENLAITLGGTADGIQTDVTNMAADAIVSITELFKSSAQQADDAQAAFTQAFKSATAIGDSIKTVTDDVIALRSAGIESGDQVDAAIANIGATAAQFKDTFPLIAQDIQNIINAPGTKTIETMELLNQKMAEAQSLAQSEAFLTNFESAEVGMTALQDSIDDAIPSAFDLESVLMGIGTLGVSTIFDLFDEAERQADEIDVLGNLEAQISGVDAALATLKAERATLDSGSIEDAERLREIQVEIKDAISARQLATKGILQTQTSIQAEVQKQISNAQQLAQLSGEEFNLKDTLKNIQFELTEATGAEGQLLQFINDTISAKGEMKAKEVGDQELVIQLQTESLEKEIAIVEAKIATAEATGFLTDEIEESLELEIEKLDTQIESLSVIEDQADASEDLADTEDDSLSILDEILGVREDTVDLTEEEEAIKDAVNDITSEILNNEERTSDEKLAQLQDEEDTLLVKEKQLVAEIKKLESQLVFIDAQLQSNTLAGIAQDKAIETAKSIREQVAALKEEAAIAASAAALIAGAGDKLGNKNKVDNILGSGRGPRPSRSGGSDRAGDRSKRDAEKATEKAEKDRAKAEEDAAKDRAKAEADAMKASQKRRADADKAAEKLAQERAKREEEALKERVKAEKGRIKAETDATLARIEDAKQTRLHAEALAETQREIRESAKKFGEELGRQASVQIGQAIGGLEQILKPFQSDVEKIFRNMSQVALEAEQIIANILDSIEVKNRKAGTAQDEIDVINESLVGKKAERDKITVEFGNRTISMSEVEDGIERVTAAMAEFAKTSKDSGGALSTAQSNAKAAKESFIAIAEALAAVETAQKKLGDETDANRIQFSNLAVRQTELVGQYDRAKAAAVRYSDEVSRVKSNIENANIDMGRAEVAMENLTGAQEALALLTKDATEEIDKQEAAIQPLRDQITKLNLDVIELNDQMEDVEGNGGSVAKAQASAKRFAGVAQAFLEVGDQLNRVIELQDQAFAAANPEAAVQKFDEAQVLMDRLTSEFELFGITIGGLSLNLAELKKEDIAGILENAFVPLDGHDELTAAQELEKAQLEVLLTQTIDLIELRTKMRDNQIAYNESLEETIIATKRLEETQQGLESAIEGANAFTEQNTIEDQLSAVEGLHKAWISVTEELNEQKATAQELIEKNKIIKKQAQDELVDVQAEIAAKRAEIEETKAQLAEAKELGLTTEIAALSEELATQQKNLNLYTDSEEQLTESIDDSTDAIIDQKDALVVLKDAQDDVNDARDEGDPVARAKDQAKAQQKQIEGMNKVISGLQNISALGEEAATAVIDITTKIGAGDIEGAVLAGAELTQKIGTALLDAKYPLNVAGAFLVGAGVIAAGVAKISQAITGEEITALDTAKARLRITKMQNKELQGQLDIMQEMADIGDASVDTARERLDILRETRQEMIDGNAELDKTLPELIADKQALKDNNAELANAVTFIEEAADMSSTERGRRIAQTAASHGIDIDLKGITTESELAAFLDVLNARISDNDDKIEAIDLGIDINKQILDEQFALLDERIASADFRIQIATDLEDPVRFRRAMDDRAEAAGDALATALASAAGVDFDFGGFDLDDLTEFSKIIEVIWDGGEVPEAVQASYDEFMETLRGSEEAAAAFVESLLADDEKQLELIEARERAGELTDEESEKQRLANLEEQRRIILEQIGLLGMSVELELLLLNINERINAVKMEGNEVEGESNKLLTDAIRKRQQLLEIARGEAAGGTITADQRAQLEESEQVIIRQMRESGATDAEINEFLKTLPAFESGGIVPATGPAIVHEGELVIPANMVNALDEQIMNMASLVSRTIPTVNGTDDLTKEFSRIILEKEALQINNSLVVNSAIGDIIINVPNALADTKGIAETVKAEISSAIIGTVQHGIDQNQLDFRGKRV